MIQKDCVNQTNFATVNSHRSVLYVSDRELPDVPFHYHDFRTVVFILSGNVEYSIEGKIYSLQPYDIVLIDTGEVHRVTLLDDSPYTRVVFSLKENSDFATCFEKLHKKKLSILRTASSPATPLHMVCQKLAQSLQAQKYGSQSLEQFPFLEFLTELQSAILSDSTTYLTIHNSDRRILSVLSYIQEHLSEELTIEKFAESMKISDYYFMHLFKNHVGYSLGNYTTNKRLIFAKSLIESGLSTTTACFDCGFKNYSTFFRCYKKLFGKSPAAEKKTKVEKSLFEDFPS